MTESHFRRVAYEIEWTGYPYCLQHPTNRAFLQVKDGIPSDSALNFLWTLVRIRLSERDSDLIRLFIKPEPHKLSKLESQSISVVDQIIDQMIFGSCNDRMIDNCQDIPSKAGWTPS